MHAGFQVTPDVREICARWVPVKAVRRQRDGRHSILRRISYVSARYNVDSWYQYGGKR